MFDPINKLPKNTDIEKNIDKKILPKIFLSCRRLTIGCSAVSLGAYRINSTILRKYKAATARPFKLSVRDRPMPKYSTPEYVIKQITLLFAWTPPIVVRITIYTAIAVSISQNTPITKAEIIIVVYIAMPDKIKPYPYARTS